jgi:hypothetical protein
MEKESKYQGDTSNELARSSQTNEVAGDQARSQSAEDTDNPGGQANLMAQTRNKSDLLDRPVTTSRGTLPDGREAKVQKSSYLGTLMERGIAITLAKELQEENAKLAVKAEKYDRYRQNTKDAYKRRKAADPDRIDQLNKEKQQRYRDRKKAARSQNQPKS